MKRILLSLLILTQQAVGQDIPQAELSASISEVTVFLQGAHITRTGTIHLKTGQQVLTLASLSPYLDSKSIQVKATGNFTILSVNHAYNYLSQRQKNHQLDSLQQLIKSLELESFRHQTRLAVLGEKQSLLHENKYLGSDVSGVALAQLEQAVVFYDQELSAIKSEELTTTLAIEKLEKKQEKIEQQIADVSGQDDLPSGEIQIRVDAEKPTRAEFTITYLVENAGWYPNYDVRVESVDQPLMLSYKADVYQNTGVDWPNVKLQFSNATPNQSGVAPELTTWRLNYTRNTVYRRPSLLGQSVRTVSGKVISDEDGEPLPGVNILVKGSIVGTVTDIEGNYSLTLPNGAATLVVSSIGFTPQDVPINDSQINVVMEPDIMSLEEVVVVGYGSDATNSLHGRVPGVQIRGQSSRPKARSIITTTVENQTTVDFEVAAPYSIQSDGEKRSITLKQYDIEADYRYYAVPKLDQNAFLIAQITNWNQYHLLEGEANLYFEEAYVGRSVLDATALSDTIKLSLGRDRSIAIQRTKMEEFTKQRVMGANQVESREFEIVARNQKSSPVTITIYDQLPVPAISNISVEPVQLSGGKYQKETGKVEWQIVLPPQNQKMLALGYKVKYPKRETVPLE
ncbi:MAG: mucoidy inhibitor MuiA family protein [Bacteroidota bacterium]